MDETEPVDVDCVADADEFLCIEAVIPSQSPEQHTQMCEAIVRLLRTFGAYNIVINDNDED